MNIIRLTFLLLAISAFSEAQIPQAIRLFSGHKVMRGASFSLVVKEVESGEVICSYDPDRRLTPASVLKLVTTAAALEILGEEYRYVTAIEYDGELKNGLLSGNIYIKGSGDPTLGSSHFSSEGNIYPHNRNAFFPKWMEGIRQKAITSVAGEVIADESCFDSEGVAMKWQREDIGSYYGAGSYGLNVFDNIYKLYLNSSGPGNRPEIVRIEPSVQLKFHNYLSSADTPSDSSYIVGMPFDADRYLYGTLPVNRKMYMLRGDIPDPPLFLAQYLHAGMTAAGIQIKGPASCMRMLLEENRLPLAPRTLIASTYSPALAEIVRITNERSHNLYADALLKTIGAASSNGAQPAALSTAGKGIQALREHWAKRGISMASEAMYDGCGIAAANKLSASFLCNLLVYMASRSPQSAAFVGSLPQAGIEGSVRNFLRGTKLQGHAFLKSGGMTGVRSYAGYIDKEGKRYALVIIANNYNGSSSEITREIEKLLLGIF
ncbi:MAG: D-alanyl-D-alanine carboxypeptidase/D-alanyl-D-alanine-endopeptidase [Tannerellaceae bacterium]|jgi:D-alanyl-D-alanine carboxypeptidase/D-alanyl-D-alanine-endopeptidase (penicillin-binding protein 4)|nr:D-alanyl-D-alanine carboxypeptidase/D-alanyl-D-alanine-endopeptidase [Tannerellaceae bacterium]